MNTTTGAAMETTTQTDQPTAEQFAAYVAMFDFFNRALFDGALPQPLLNLSRGQQRTVAFFAPERWTKAETRTHEISLSPRYLSEGSALDAAQSLVHEMVHMWQHLHGKPARGGYHNREWSTKMIAVGLQPINAKTGQPAMSAPSMSDRVIPSGRFEVAFAELPIAARLPWSCVEARRTAAPKPDDGDDNDGEGEGEPTPAPNRNKVKYSCQSCGANVWGKPGMKMACFGSDKNGMHEPAIFAVA